MSRATAFLAAAIMLSAYTGAFMGINALHGTLKKADQDQTSTRIAVMQQDAGKRTSQNAAYLLPLDGADNDGQCAGGQCQIRARR